MEKENKESLLLQSLTPAIDMAKIMEAANEYTMKYRGRLSGAEEFGELVIKSLPGGNVLRLMNSPDEVFGDVSAYMRIIYAGLLVTGAYNTLAAFLRALGDSKSPMYFINYLRFYLLSRAVFMSCILPRCSGYARWD